MAIHFHNADVQHTLTQKNALKRWIKACVSEENRVIGTINIIFCSDDYLLNLNRQHLSHDYYTDIITFDYSEDKLISGDLFVSSERVFDNASRLGVSANTETYRVIIHGIMHLCGYKDKTKKEIQTMRQKEDTYLGKILINTQ